jgi:hypothetical protein
MSARRVEFLCAGIGIWGKPVRHNATTMKVCYEAKMTQRLSFEGGPTIYLATRFAGMDDVGLDPENAVPGGYGAIESRDEDGDWLLGWLDWVETPEASFGPEGDRWAGDFKWHEGTGKWEGVSGGLRAYVWALPADLEAEWPPKGYFAEFHGFLEGEGELTVPNLPS